MTNEATENQDATRRDGSRLSEGLVFDVMNLHHEDHFCDVFPGSGAVSEAWHKWCQRAQPVQHGLFAEA